MDSDIDYHNYLCKKLAKDGFPTTTPSIRCSCNHAFNEAVRATERRENLSHEDAVDTVGNIWMAGAEVEDSDDEDNEGE